MCCFPFHQREQEWNISRKELAELVKVGILDEDDIEQATAAEFNPVSCIMTFLGHGLISVKSFMKDSAYVTNNNRFHGIMGTYHYHRLHSNQT